MKFDKEYEARNIKDKSPRAPFLTRESLGGVDPTSELRRWKPRVKIGTGQDYVFAEGKAIYLFRSLRVSVARVKGF